MYMQARYATASNIDDDINDNDGKDYNDRMSVILIMQ